MLREAGRGFSRTIPPPGEFYAVHKKYAARYATAPIHDASAVSTITSDHKRSSISGKRRAISAPGHVVVATAFPAEKNERQF